MKKPSTNVFFASFMSYLMLYFAMPYVTALDWANWVSYFFILTVLYQITYVIYLRKKDNVSFGGAVAKLFLCLSLVCTILIVYTYADAFFNGYIFSFLTFYSERYYGFEAWKHMGWESIILIPLLSLSSIYQIILFIMWKKAKKL